MKIRTVIATLTFLLLSTPALSHDGHDHGAPTFSAPKGGILKSSLQGHFELVKENDLAKVYHYDAKGKAKDTKGLNLKAELELPRKKSVALDLQDKGTHWESKIDAQNAHRYTLKITIDDGKEKDHVKFTVESH